jgi:hypothetical protein
LNHWLRKWIHGQGFPPVLAIKVFVDTLGGGDGILKIRSCSSLMPTSAEIRTIGLPRANLPSEAVDGAGRVFAAPPRRGCLAHAEGALPAGVQNGGVSDA